MRVSIVGNCASFPFNLVQYLGELGASPAVVRNDLLPAARAQKEHAPDRLVVSPGPGRPEEAGRLVEYVRTLGGQIPTLGVCLGHQAIGVAFGGRVDRAPEPRHGKTSQITHDGRGVFGGLANPLVATRYHSLAAVEIPAAREVAATSEDGVVQALRHRPLPIVGVQFHPESIMAPAGKRLLAKFLAGRI